MKRCLITGCEGFVGSHLADLLIGKGVPGYGTAYGDAANLNHLKRVIKLLECDPNDRERVAEIVQAVRPDVVTSNL